jgi:hypothetical protein
MVLFVVIWHFREPPKGMSLFQGAGTLGGAASEPLQVTDTIELNYRPWLSQRQHQRFGAIR